MLRYRIPCFRSFVRRSTSLKSFSLQPWSSGIDSNSIVSCPSKHCRRGNKYGIVNREQCFISMCWVWHVRGSYILECVQLWCMYCFQLDGRELTHCWHDYRWSRGRIEYSRHLRPLHRCTGIGCSIAMDLYGSLRKIHIVTIILARQRFLLYLWSICTFQVTQNHRNSKLG